LVNYDMLCCRLSVCNACNVAKLSTGLTGKLITGTQSVIVLRVRKFQRFSALKTFSNFGVKHKWGKNVHFSTDMSLYLRYR